MATGLVLGGLAYVLLQAWLVPPDPHIRLVERSLYVTVPVSAAPSTPEPTVPPAPESHDLDERREVRPILLYTAGDGMPLPPGARPFHGYATDLFYAVWADGLVLRRTEEGWARDGRFERGRLPSKDLQALVCRVDRAGFWSLPVEEILGPPALDIPVGHFTIRKGREARSWTVFDESALPANLKPYPIAYAGALDDLSVVVVRQAVPAAWRDSVTPPEDRLGNTIVECETAVR